MTGRNALRADTAGEAEVSPPATRPSRPPRPTPAGEPSGPPAAPPSDPGIRAIHRPRHGPGAHGNGRVRPVRILWRFTAALGAGVAALVLVAVTPAAAAGATRDRVRGRREPRSLRGPPVPFL